MRLRFSSCATRHSWLRVRPLSKPRRRSSTRAEAPKSWAVTSDRGAAWGVVCTLSMRETYWTKLHSSITFAAMPETVHVLYETPAWLPQLCAGLEAEGLPYRLHEVWRGTLDLASEPEPGIYLNRMSPSSHTRGHLESVDLMVELLAWLEHHGRRVINGSRPFALEISKVKQDLALQRHGILTPRTVMAVGREELLRAASSFDGPFITKHNQGGKGLGIRLFQSADELASYLDSDEFDPGPRGQVLLQQYIRPRELFITRVEILGGRFLYALRSDTS